MNTVLVPTKFNNASDYALHAALAYAKKSNSKIHLLHVVAESEDFHTAEMAMTELGNSQLLRGIPVSKSIVKGKLKENLDMGEPDIIFLGDHETTSTIGILETNFNQLVIKTATCPVITVKGHTDFSKIRSIVFPTDMRADQGKIIDEIKEMQALYNAHIHLIKVYSNNIMKDYDVEKKLDQFAKQHGLVDYSVTAKYDLREVESILAFAESLHTDMIMMATHDRMLLERFLTGYVSGGVVKNSRISVWTKLVPG